MMKIARFIATYMAICIPFMSMPLFFVITDNNEENEISIKSDYWNTCNRSSRSPSSEPQCMFRKYLLDLWIVIYMVIFFPHIVGLIVIFANKLKELKGFAIFWLMFNLILIIPLIGLQAYVSYIVHNFFLGCAQSVIVVVS